MARSVSLRLAFVHVLYLILCVFAIGKCQNHRKLECPRDLINTPCSCKKTLEHDGLDVVCEGADVDQIGNLLQKIPNETIIKNMRLRGNQIVHLPGFKFQHLHIHHLSITRSNVQDIDPMAFFNLDHTLHTLDLSSNLLNTIPAEAIKRLKMLKTLYLSTNLIARIKPNTFAGMSSLLNLYLENNEIEELHSFAFNGADNLTKIQLNHNKLKQLPGSMFSKLAGLEELYLSHNNLTDFPEGFFQGVTDSLNRLDLNHNLFPKVPVAIASLQQLEILNMNHNCLEDVAGNAFSSSLSSQLGAVDLSYNNLTRLPVEALTTLDNLNNLNLQNNSISQIPNHAFKSVGRSLKYLYLQRNRISNISAKAFQGVKSLEWLYLSKNMITTLQQETFQEVKRSLKILDIHDNPLKCDCKLKWITHAQWAQLLTHEKETKCREPPESFEFPVTRSQNYPVICEPVQTEAQKLRKDPDNNGSLKYWSRVVLLFCAVFVFFCR